MLNYTILPRHMQDDMKAYIERGVPQGFFMRAIIANDFVHAAIAADCQNRYRLFEYARFLHDEAPMVCWGNYDAYKKWVEIGGAEGFLKEEQNGEEA